MNALHYYVYYRVEPARLEELRAVVAALFSEVHAATRIQGRLQRRRDDPSTWMEIYENVADPADFERALEGALRECDFTRLSAKRKTEIFQCA